ncbi:MAG: hypothetical protein HUU45_13630 [Leptospiraceae bacterium]|nr:hypothetical protein [Leptospiraceae bacterium]
MEGGACSLVILRRLRIYCYGFRLEAFLLRNPELIHSLSGFKNGLTKDYTFEILNQISTYIAGGAIDIACIYKKKVLDLWLKIGVTVFELKRGIIDPFYVDQIIRYIEWASRLIPGAKKEMIKGILIGRDFGNQVDIRNLLLSKIRELRGLYHLEAYTYYIEDNSLKFKNIAE